MKADQAHLSQQLYLLAYHLASCRGRQSACFGVRVGEVADQCSLLRCQSDLCAALQPGDHCLIPGHSTDHHNNAAVIVR